MKNKRLQYLFLVSMLILLAVILVSVFSNKHSSIPTSIPETASPSGSVANRSISILMDDFSPQPYQEESVYFFNRLEGDRGAINNSIMGWGDGEVTTTISLGNSWGGVWMSLNHPIREGLSINFSAILPPQILPAYQIQITGITVLVARGTPNRTIKLELKNGNELRWKNEIILDGGQQALIFDLPALGNINQLVWVLDHASAGDYVVLDSVSFTATTQVTDTATAAFVWSYGMLLNNWNPSTGLVRDKAKDASGEFDAIQATGCLAAATAVAEQIGIVEHADAVQIVNKISNALLLDLPRFHGLWPHWVKTSPTGEISIVENTEWSSVDTVIAAIGLLEAQSGLGLGTDGTEQMLRAIEWSNLVTSGGISHGYTYSGNVFPYAWDTFGGESWLVELAYAGSTGQVTPITYSTPPTANGSGFIDELAWLFVAPPSGQDYWGTDWASYRVTAAENQISYSSTNYPASCFTQFNLFGLSAAEVPSPSLVPQNSIYQAFGAGGRFAGVNDGSALLGAPVVIPHYSAMIASLRPEETIEMWDWLIENGYFSPLNNVESLVFPANSDCDPDSMEWNQLKGSWNLSLQTLGWGRYLAGRNGQVPILWQATIDNSFLRKGYLLLVPGGPTSTLTPTLPSLSTPWVYERECEYSDNNSVGQVIWRANASGSKVHGQIGTTADSPWPAKSGYVNYNNINTPQPDHLYLKLRYSKYSPSSVPILIYMDDEPTPRATLYPIDQGSWEQFAWTELIPLGNIESGVHSIRFSTEGQQYGVADLDKFVLMAESASTDAPPKPVAVYIPQSSETPVTTIWDNTQVSCDGKPLYMWSLPGTYLYKYSNRSNGNDYSTLAQISIKEGFNEDTIWETNETLPEPDGSNITGRKGSYPGPISISVAEVEEKTTSWGTAQAVRVDITGTYDRLTGRLDIVKGSHKTSEWYVCGLGLVHFTSSEAGTNNGMSFQSQSEIVLWSYTPFSTNESHVRYILVDMQLGDIVDTYRANTSDEETAEALRRWDAGVRVVNIDKFERKIVNGQAQIVYVGIENSIKGMDVNLTSDPQQ